jgi:hypothetical protein
MRLERSEAGVKGSSFLFFHERTHESLPPALSIISMSLDVFKANTPRGP